MGYQVKTEPMPAHRSKAIGDPTTRYRVLVLYVPGSIIDWSKAQERGRDLTWEEACELEEKLERAYKG